MAGWHYRVRVRKLGTLYLYDVVEFYPDKGPLWTHEGIKPSGLSRKEVIRELKMMLKDCQKYSTLTDKIGG